MNFYSSPQISDSRHQNTPKKVLRRRAVISVAGADIIQAYAEDLDQDGISIVSPIPLTRSANCAIAIDVPVQGAVRKLRAPGRVISCALSGLSGFRVRVQFTAPDETISSLLG